ncbi:hypothetical protein AC1031_006307 [Aphanomyces cochlioides]|nr:hypothetical protein AC1031_006307 [Aphanomyces cochlioides]
MEFIAPSVETNPFSAIAQMSPLCQADGERTIAVFDWDDTLCPSSWLNAQGLLPLYRGHVVPLNSMVRQVLSALEERIFALLTKAMSYGPVFVVTAAEKGWVEAASTMYMPTISALFKKSNDVHVVSARSWFETTFGCGGDARHWKIEVLGLIASKCFGNRYGFGSFNLISVGDSLAERDACHAAVSAIPETVLFAKSLTFIEYPDAHEILQQIDLACSYFDHMCAWNNHLDLRITRDQLHALH